MEILPTIAAAQTIPVAGDIPTNVAQHARLAHLAADHDARFLVFPELSLTGYELELADSLALAAEDRRLDPLREIASAREITLIVGAPVRMEGKLLIAAVILHSNGEIECYTKHHLGAFGESAKSDGTVPLAEREVFTAGTLDPKITVGAATASLAICADVGQRQHAECAAQAGSQLFFASMFVIPSEMDREVARLHEIATTHSMIVLFSNYGGPTGNLASAGGTRFFLPDGARTGELPHSGAGVALLSLDADGFRGTALEI